MSQRPVVVSGLQHGAGLVLREYKRLAEEVVLGALGAFEQEVFALEIRQLFGGSRRRAAHAKRQTLEFFHGRRVGIPLVPGEDLIRAFARENHRHFLPGQLRQEVQRHAGRVRLRLVHVVLDVRESVEAFVRRDELAAVADAKLVRKLGRVVRLVEFVVIKAHAERGVRHQHSGNVAGIHAAGEERADLYVRNAVGGHGFVHHFVQLVRADFKVLRLRVEFAVPEAAHVHLAVLIHKIVGRGQLVHALEEGFLCGGILQRQIGAQRILVDGLDEFGMLEKGLDLAAEHQPRAVRDGVIVKRLDAENVPRAEHTLVFGVPQHERKHAAQAIDQLRAVFLVAVDEHLGVGATVERVAFGLKLPPQLHKIVDLAVEYNDHAFVLVGHGLCACVGQVQDGQAPEPQRDAVVCVHAAHVRAAVDDTVHHFLQDCLFVIKIAGKADKSTHSGVTSCLPRSRAAVQIMAALAALQSKPMGVLPNARIAFLASTSMESR